MRIIKKERRVVELVVEHIDKTGECLEAMADAVKVLFSSGYEQAAVPANRVNSIESEADGLVRGIRALLFSGAYLPLNRGDIYRLMSALDAVANKVEDCYDFFNCQKPRIAEEYQADILAIVETTGGCFAEFRDALRAFFKPRAKMDKLREHTRNVSELESLIDKTERALTVQIFDSSLPLIDKVHLRQFLSTLVRISDVIENAADELELVSLKSLG